MNTHLFEDLGPTATERYWHDEGLATLCQAGATETAALPPQMSDLVRLHRIARRTMAVTILEFGVGYSTIVLADALARNEADYRQLKNPPKLRAALPFHLHTVDASQRWLDHTAKRIPGALASRVLLFRSTVSVGNWSGRICHFYDTLPDVVPDLVYLDGPDPKDVSGDLRGLSFNTPDRTVMAADLLAMEPTLLPGCTIICDGRVNNARFLARNFQRPFRHTLLPDTDITIFHLDEPPLGPHSPNLAALVNGADALGKMS